LLITDIKQTLSLTPSDPPCNFPIYYGIIDSRFTKVSLIPDLLRYH